jgi:hypothetical protein
MSVDAEKSATEGAKGEQSKGASLERATGKGVTR